MPDRTPRLLLVPLALLMALSLQGCLVGAVAGAAVETVGTVAGAGVKATGKVVGAGVRVVAGGDSKKKDDKK